MGKKLRPCTYCKGAHRTKTSARKCALKYIKPKAWTRAELNL